MENFYTTFNITVTGFENENHYFYFIDECEENRLDLVGLFETHNVFTGTVFTETDCDIDKIKLRINNICRNNRLNLERLEVSKF